MFAITKYVDIIHEIEKYHYVDVLQHTQTQD